MTTRKSVDPNTVERLRQALAAYEAGERSSTPFFDRAAEEAKAAIRHRALLLLDHRARSCQEMRDRLVALEFAPELVDDVITELKRDRLLDDALFAHEWVRQRHNRRGKSRSALDHELQNKGIATELRRDALEIIAQEDEDAKAWELAVKKAQSIKADCSEDYAEYTKALRRIVGVLARRGFPQSTSLTMARRALDQRLEQLAA